MLAKIRICLTIVLLALVSSACTMSLPVQLVKPTPDHGEIIYKDDFSRSNSGWSTWKQDLSEVFYASGALHIRINEPRYDYWSRPGKRFADARVEVDAARTGGSENNDFGIICRYRNGDNFYSFFISSDGYYGIVRVKDGQYDVLNADQLQFSDAIHKGSVINHMRGDCVGNTLTLYVNGQKLAQAQDSNFKSGEVGLLAGSYDASGVEVVFDNFIVMKP